MSRYYYATGYRSYERAREALFGMFADGEVCKGEFPEIESYIAKNGKRRYGITVRG